MHRRLAILSLVLVALSYVIMNVAVRLLGKGFEPMTQVYLRVLLGAIIASVAFSKNLRVSIINKISSKDWLILGLMGSLSYSIAVFFITKGALLASLLNVAIIYSTVNFFTYLYSLVFLKEKFKPISLFLITISFYGILLVSTNSFLPSISGFGIGELFVLIAAATMSFYSVGRKMLSKTLNNSEISIITMLIAFASGLILALLLGEKLPIASFFDGWVLVGLLLGGLLNIVATFLSNYGFEHLDIVLGNQILLVESLFSVVIGYLFYHELVTWPQIVGAIIVLAAVYVSNKIL